jgi:hypothetical protein
MIRDVFYFGKKPNVHPRERYATSLEHARQLSTTEHFWIVNEYCIYKDFDWEWDFEFLADEDIWAQEHINVWPSQHQKDSGTWLCNTDNLNAYVIYRADVPPVLRKNEKNEQWVIIQPVDETKFDFSWHPDAHEPPYIYVWGNKFIAGEIKPTIEYHVPGATDRKYIVESVEVLPEWDNWFLLKDIDNSSFDFSWRPDPREPAYIYTWGNKYEPAEVSPTLEYRSPGATERKYMGDTVDVLPEWDKWNILYPVDKSSFDFSWRPDPREPNLIYVFGNEWYDSTIMPTIEYVMEGASDRKYVDSFNKAKLLAHPEKFDIFENFEGFDYSWVPNPTSPPYIYVWGNQWNSPRDKISVQYIVPGATEYKYMDECVTRKPCMDNWVIHENIIISDFDFSWEPNPKDPPYIYQFGTQWAKTNGPKFIVAGAEETKFVNDPVATILPDMSCWEIPENIDVSKFDFSWHPDMTSPPYIYQFGTLLDDTDGPRYITPGHDGIVVKLERTEIVLSELDFPKYYIKTTINDLIKEHTGEIFWALRSNINYENFDFSWIPSKENVYHINAFGSPDSETTQTYFVNGKMIQKGYSDINFVENIKLNEEYLASLFKPVNMFYIDRGNKESQYRFDMLKERFPDIQKTRYLNTWVDTINRCVNRSTTELCWILNSEIDYSSFDFNYYPSPWQMRMVHVFGTQWSHWGTTFMVNKNSFPEDTKYVKVIEHLSILNFVKRKPTKATDCLYDVVIIDHDNSEIDTVLSTIKNKVGDKNVTVVKYKTSYLNTFKELLKDMNHKKEHYLWICSSICDYTNFDFSYICDPYAKDQLHVFPSDKQKFGDTFLVDVNKFNQLVDDMLIMQDYEKINYNQHQRVNRLMPPTIITEDDTLTKVILQDFDFPYAVFKTSDNKDLDVVDLEPISLWTLESKNILVTSTGGTRLIVPKEAKEYVKKELYDYPYISKSTKLAKSQPLDIIFISNGEASADENYDHLLKVTKGFSNRVVRVDGVKGRLASQHAAANEASTPWYYLVNAKLEVNRDFDFDWQPDRLQIPKHYIFHAKNPVNGLEYGHQAIVANNKLLTLQTVPTGLDFTMESEVEVVPVNCGIARYNSSEWDTYRTAFRECIKLAHATDHESKQRLAVWLNVAEGDFAQYSLQGAQDAVNFHIEVNGNIEQLKLSYDWQWIRVRFDNLYK